MENINHITGLNIKHNLYNRGAGLPKYVLAYRPVPLYRSPISCLDNGTYEGGTELQIDVIIQVFSLFTFYIE
jgi:hypothetical protein